MVTQTGVISEIGVHKFSEGVVCNLPNPFRLGVYLLLILNL